MNSANCYSHNGWVVTQAYAREGREKGKFITMVRLFKEYYAQGGYD